jgi:hypothetical protein
MGSSKSSLIVCSEHIDYPRTLGERLLKLCFSHDLLGSNDMVGGLWCSTAILTSKAAEKFYCSRCGRNEQARLDRSLELKCHRPVSLE